MDVLVTCKYEEDPIKNEGARVVTTLYSKFSSSFIFESIILILAGNEDMHESLDEFKFRPDTDTNTRSGESWKIAIKVIVQMRDHT